MKGIILAAGKGTRLYPMTYPICKPLLPVFDKPMIYYPLGALIQAGIRDILIIVPPEGLQNAFESALGDGSQFGVHISYMEQPEARGIADALILGADFFRGDQVCLALGDNIFYSPDLSERLMKAASQNDGATVFGYWVEDPRPFGVVEFDDDCNVVSLEEKPENPKSNYVVPGLYFYDEHAAEIASGLTPSARGELEITDVNKEYLKQGKLKVVPLEKGCTWYDAGNAVSLLDAATEIHRLQQENDMLIGCIEETAWRQGFITDEEKDALADKMKQNYYGQYLLNLKKDEDPE
ncbi:MAG: glucose-1-phosphate thymidylyltransferase RfbA [Oscillospiraceae bacterium]|nr:glucose-1-phosphate thymidylyltransferase RfbA [Oscillospiraceae bacterium]